MALQTDAVGRRQITSKIPYALFEVELLQEYQASAHLCQNHCDAISTLKVHYLLLRYNFILFEIRPHIIYDMSNFRTKSIMFPLGAFVVNKFNSQTIKTPAEPASVTRQNG